MKHIFLSFIILIAIYLPASAQIVLEKVYLTSIAGEGDLATDESKDVILGQDVRLNLVISGRQNDKPVFFSTTKKIQLLGGTIPEKFITTWDEQRLGQIQINWFHVEPYLEHEKRPGNDPDNLDYNHYTNVKTKSLDRKWIGHDQIEYYETAIPEFVNLWQVPVTARPSTWWQDTHGGLGTMRFRVEIAVKSGTSNLIKRLSSPGLENTDKHGITTAVHRLSFRKDNSYLGWLTPYFNVPGVLGATDEQVDNYLGVDCADLVVAGMRKRKPEAEIPYTDVNGLPELMTKITETLYLYKDGFLFKDKTLTIKTGLTMNFSGVKAGDVMLIDYPSTSGPQYGKWEHCGIVYEDSGPEGKADGVFNKYDQILHAGPEEPRVSALTDKIITKGRYPCRIQFFRWDLTLKPPPDKR